MSSPDHEHDSSSEIVAASAPQDRFWDSFFGGTVVAAAELGTYELPEMDGSLDDELLGLLAHDFEISNYEYYDDGFDLSHTDTSSTDTSFFDD